MKIQRCGNGHSCTHPLPDHADQKCISASDKFYFQCSVGGEKYTVNRTVQRQFGQHFLCHFPEIFQFQDSPWPCAGIKPRNNFISGFLQLLHSRHFFNEFFPFPIFKKVFLCGHQCSKRIAFLMHTGYKNSLLHYLSLFCPYQTVSLSILFQIRYTDNTRGERSKNCSCLHSFHGAIRMILSL